MCVKFTLGVSFFEARYPSFGGLKGKSTGKPKLFWGSLKKDTPTPHAQLLSLRKPIMGTPRPKMAAARLVTNGVVCGRVPGRLDPLSG